MQHLLELRGVTRDEPVVVYEEGSGVRAARLVWLLALFGHPEARLLDGGIGRWRAEAPSRRPRRRRRAELAATLSSS